MRPDGSQIVCHTTALCVEPSAPCAQFMSRIAEVILFGSKLFLGFCNISMITISPNIMQITGGQTLCINEFAEQQT